MATPSISPDTTLQLKRTFEAPRERVYRAWTDPEEMKNWAAPSEDYEVAAVVDLRVGGKYRIQMTHRDGAVHTAHGEYREVSPPEKLVFFQPTHAAAPAFGVLAAAFGVGESLVREDKLGGRTQVPKLNRNQSVLGEARPGVMDVVFAP